MRILIIGSRETLVVRDPQYYDKYQAYLQAALPDGEGSVDVAYISDLYIGIGDSKFDIRTLPNNRDLREYDVVFLRGQTFRRFRDVLKVVSVYCVMNKVVIINDYGKNRDGSKLTQAVQFFEAGLPLPYTVLVTAGLLANPDTLGIAFPLVMKATFGARGEDNYLVHSIEEIRCIAAENPELRFILQRLIPNDGDYRLLFIGDETALIHRKGKDGSHLNNTSQGATASLVPVSTLPPEIVEGARRYIRSHYITTAGVDVLTDKHTAECYFLEVNSQPQLTSGAFLEMKTELMGAYLQSLQS